MRSKASSRTKSSSACSLDLDRFLCRTLIFSVGRIECEAEGLGVSGLLEVTVVAFFSKEIAIKWS